MSRALGILLDIHAEKEGIRCFLSPSEYIVHSNFVLSCKHEARSQFTVLVSWNLAFDISRDQVNTWRCREYDAVSLSDLDLTGCTCMFWSTTPQIRHFLQKLSRNHRKCARPEAANGAIALRFMSMERAGMTCLCVLLCSRLRT